MKYFIYRLVEPRTHTDDLRRREFIFNILVVSIISLLLFSAVSSTITFLFISDPISRENTAVPIITILVELILFLALYLASRKGFFILASYVFVSILFLLGTYMWYRWGVDVPFGILSQTLVIVISGILISTRFAFIVTIIIGVVMSLIGYFQRIGSLEINSYWKSEAWTYADTAVAIVIFFIIATVSWLSNREIEKSLKRARKSEAELKEERDLLEITVEERTKELKEAQAERMTQLYRFAEFGRLSSGIFHDLINPLNAVSLNMEKVKNSNKNTLKQIEGETGAVPISEAAEYVDKAIRSAKRLEDMVTAVRKQLVRKESNAVFSLNEEIEYVIDVLSHKAKKAHVEINFSAPEDIKLFGDAIKFNQIVLNLIANAIDSYSSDTSGGKGTVEISLDKESGKIALKVADRGMGIPEENIQKIFEPFFTTKPHGDGLGLGLSMTKRIVEKDFGGTISVSSKVRETSFTVQLPEKNEPEPAISDR